MALLDRLRREILGGAQTNLPPLPAFGTDFIKSLVSAHDSRPDTRSLAAPGAIHVSDLRDFCPRRYTLRIRDDIPLGGAPRNADRVVWAMGKAAERHVRTALIEALGYRGVIGKWECKCGALHYDGTHDLNRKCPRCGERALHYGEIDLADHTAGIQGHPDLILYLHRRLIAVEIKSKNKKDFLALVQPDPDHVLQLGAYQRILKASQRVPVAPAGVIFYVCKEYDFRVSPYKEFHAELDGNEWLQNLLAVKWESALAATEAVRLGTLPPRILACSSSASTTARNCHACVNCFARQ